MTVWVLLTAGRGPAECQIATLKMSFALIGEATALGLQTEILERRETDSGLTSILIAIEGENANSFAETWNGTLHWRWQSPYRSKDSRKNWYVGGMIIHQPPEDMALRESDLAFATYRASGPGGQHVNKTESAVRVTHRPSGLSAQSQDMRSQRYNRAIALRRLAGLFALHAIQTKQATAHEKWSQHDLLQRGNPIRIYIGEEFKKVKTG